MVRHTIDYAILVKNVEVMINLLEYDAMRSSGKAKTNSATLNDLYELADRYNSFTKTKVEHSSDKPAKPTTGSSASKVKK